MQRIFENSEYKDQNISISGKNFSYIFIRLHEKICESLANFKIKKNTKDRITNIFISTAIF